tara:strand:- start:15 stop:782 length:768 start_codon:yes stop_codon:yes gene_type:complete
MSDVPRGPDWWQDKDGQWYPSHVSSSEDNAETSKVPPEDIAESNEENEESLPEYFSRTYGWGGESEKEEPILVIGGGNVGDDDDPKYTTLTERAPTAVHQPVRPVFPPDLFSGALGVVGAIFLVIGSFLDWATAGGSLTTGVVEGIGDSNGIGTLITGSLCAFVAGLFLSGQRKRWVGLAMIISASVAVALSIYSIVDITSTSNSIPENLVERFPTIDVAFASNAKLDFDLGLWAVLGGSVISLLAGLSGFKRHT